MSILVVFGDGIQTHGILNTSLLPYSLDQGFIGLRIQNIFALEWERVLM